MGSRMKDLYDFPESIDEQDIYIQDLAEQCAVLAGRVQEMMESLPEEKRQLLEAYIFDIILVTERTGKPFHGNGQNHGIPLRQDLPQFQSDRACHGAEINRISIPRTAARLSPRKPQGSGNILLPFLNICF